MGGRSLADRHQSLARKFCIAFARFALPWREATERSPLWSIVSNVSRNRSGAYVPRLWRVDAAGQAARRSGADALPMPTARARRCARQARDRRACREPVMQACGSTSFSLHVSMSEATRAQFSAPSSWPAKSASDHRGRSADGALDDVRVELDAAVVEEADQPFPVVQTIAESPVHPDLPETRAS